MLKLRLIHFGFLLKDRTHWRDHSLATSCAIDFIVARNLPLDVDVSESYAVSS